MDILQHFFQQASVLENEYIKKHKDQGGKVFAAICTFTPGEIIHAAGGLPLRMRSTGSKSTERAEVYYSPTHCSFVRHTLNQALLNEYSFCDGVIFATTCDHARRMFDNWRYTNAKPDMRYLLTVPHVGHDNAIESFAQDLRLLADEISKHTGIKIDNDKLNKSIKLYNEQRRLLAQINELRKRAIPPISGTEMLTVWQTLTAIPVEAGNELLRNLLNELQKVESAESSKSIRLFLATTHFEDIDRMQALESGKAIIVQDMSCVGNAHFSTEVEESDDPFMALATRAIKRPSCPNIVDRFKDRLTNAVALAKEWNCDGIVFDHLQFCTIGDVEAYIYRQEMDKLNIPYVSLQHELYGGGAGQVRTRIEAFTEQIINLKRV